MSTTCLTHRCYVTVSSGYCVEHRPRRTSDEEKARAEQPHRKLKQRRGATKKALVEQAVCWLCGHHDQPPASKYPTWHWHHVVAGDPDSRQVITHSFCNMSFGENRWPASLEGVAGWRLQKIEQGKIKPEGAMPT